MKKSGLVLIGIFFSMHVFAKDNLYYGIGYGKKVFVEMRDDSTATILILHRTKKIAHFLEPSSYKGNVNLYLMKFTCWKKNYWITNFRATKKNQSINDLPKEKVEIAKKRDWLYIFNLPDVSVDFPLRKVMRNSYAWEEYERYLK